MNGKELLRSTIVPSKIVLAIKVPTTVIDPVHTTRPSHGFAMHVEGPKTYNFWDQREINVEANTIVYMPKGSNYNVSGIKPTRSCYAINFDTAEELICEPFVYRPKDPNKLLQLFKEAEKAWRTRPAGYMEKCFSCLSEIIAIMKNELAASYIPGSRRELIAPALQYISENYTSEKISVAYLADLCGISEVYMRKLFTSTLGRSPVAHINYLRLERAKELLISGEYSVANAAADCGYGDECYFSREFKKHYGFTPGQLIKKKSE